MSPCRFEEVWMEDVVGDGGPRMEMSECNYEGNIDIGTCDCGTNCPAYEEAIDEEETKQLQKFDEMHDNGELDFQRDRNV
jgi:hypothetical protein